jgi:MinD-like ATPase involved in chromosome partitioning or flagellar assembly/ActR/RegA family two-component response regulator
MDDQPIRILLVEDNPGDALLLRKLLGEVKGVSFDLTQVGRLSDALRSLETQSFDAVLLDLNLPDGMGMGTFLRVREKAPRTAVLILTGLQDETLAVDAVKQGAQDYMVKGEVSGGDLVRSIRYAIARQATRDASTAAPHAASRGRAIGFMGAKGGVGTTTVALNVAAALATRRKAVVAVELRPTYGTFSAQLGRAPLENLSHLLALEPGEIDDDQLSSRLASPSWGAKVLFGPQSVDEFKEIGPPQAEAVIDHLAMAFEYVAIDLPCDPSGATRAAIERSDFVALVVERERGAVEAAAIAVELFKSWGVSAARLGAVFVNRSPTMATASLQELSSQIGCAAVGAVPHAAEQCFAAQRRSVPLVVSEPASIAATNLVALAARLSADVVAPMSF